MAGHVGTAHNNAAMPVQFEKNIINFLPITPSTAMFEPLHKLKYSFAVTYEQQVRANLPKLVKEKNAKRVCALYQDDEFGLEVAKGAEAALKSMGMELTEKTSYKRGATDFSSQVAKMKASSCDFVVLATIVRETIGAIGESRKSGFNPTFMSVNTAYTELIHKLGGPPMNGLYSTMTVQHPYLDETSPQIRFWANKYKTRFNEDPGTLSVYGYQIIDLLTQAIGKTGPSLTTDSLIKTLDTSKFPSDMFGASELSFTATKRLGTDLSRVSQIQDGRWKVVSDYAKP
jgi:branched-chain amino acid transport system substrate-binding protein